ncbi:MAG: PQQ-binding-like beta-propeller repeat protein [Halieaceae bacterium]|nr:PQQ-binding-like beta-propeller repeat protein [Halieaceae bacterium]
MTILLLMIIVSGAGLLLVDSQLYREPMRTIESFVIRHADKLPLEAIGGVLFDNNCATCHDNPDMLAPTREALAGFSKETLLMAMEFGKMQPMAAHLSKQERGLIAMHLVGKAENAYGWVESAQCQQSTAEGTMVYAGNWGLGNHNRRFVSDEISSITRENVGRLELAWSFAFPRVTDVRSQPVIVGDTLYIGDKAGKFYALDRRTGCVRAHTKVLTGVRSAITLAKLNDGRQLLIFADSLATVFALDPVSLNIVWQASARVYDTSVVTGSISFHNDRLYVPVSSYEVAAAGSEAYSCCKSHGVVLALDANDGDQLWQWHATEEATYRGKNVDGVDKYGPAGAVVWTTGAIDEKRNRLYFGTGENLSHPATDTSDAIVALDMDSGELVWKFQATLGDVWNASCLSNGPNCPENAGGDFDFGASVIIADLPGGGQALLAGQKSGEVFALDPDPQGIEGELLWRSRVSQGTSNGGIHWGMGVSGQRLIIPVADPERDRAGYEPKPGLYALDITDGKLLWQQRVERGCEFEAANKPLVGLEQRRSGKKRDLDDRYRCSFYYGQSAAVTVTDQLAFSAGLDGKIRAFDLENGQILWHSETAISYTASNGISGHGGSIDVAGQMLAGDWLYVLSGYSMFGQLPGNMLLAYKIMAEPGLHSTPGT